jgi:multidrug resistance protein MdtO
MATAAQSLYQWPRSVAWLREFLRQELAPYPGRGLLVARMVVAATIAMLICMTFRIPYGAYAGVFALTISRENPDATRKAVRTILIWFAAAVGDDMLGAFLFSGDPVLRLLWVIATLFITFFALSALANYNAAARFGYLVVITIPLWDRQIRTEQKVEETLWAVTAVSIASIVTVAIELVFAELKPWDDLIVSISDRLRWVEVFLRSRAEGIKENMSEQKVTQLAVLGMSRLRRDVYRSGYAPRYAEQMGSAVAWTGRVIDIAANLVLFPAESAEPDRGHLLRMAENLAGIRDDLLNGRVLHLLHPPEENEPVEHVPLIREMERAVSLIVESFTGTTPASAYAAPSAPAEPAKRLFAADAFTNPDHLRFGLRGGLAASLCYIAYNLSDWQGLSTAMATCLLTALTTIGSSRQKQVLRFGGAVVGGVIFGIGAQIFVLPAIDSIFGFTLLFVAVTFVAAWFATSGPRLSYFGVQIAVAFYLINLQEFKFQTSLSVARDRVAGILLGLLAMWLVFDQLWGAPAAIAMKRTFISTVRLLAQLFREPRSGDMRTAIEQSYALRESINTGLDKFREQADAVALEFGSSRERDLALRAQLLNWQLHLRPAFVVRVILLKYRLHLPGFELPEAVQQAQEEFDGELAALLERIADCLERKIERPGKRAESASAALEQAIQARRPDDANDPLAVGLGTFLALSRRVDALIMSLDREIAAGANLP